MNELQPGPETDRLVAEALNLDCEMVLSQEAPFREINTTGIAAPFSQSLHILPEGHLGDGPSVPFRPSTDLNDAFWAAERFCGSFFLEWHDAYAEWACWIDTQRRVKEDCRSEAWAETAPLAICAAILSLKPLSPSSTSRPDAGCSE